MSGHTPGPWTIGWAAPEGTYRYLYILDCPVTIDSENRIASVTRRAEAEANAKLIAAAPDLLKAAKDALFMLVHASEIESDRRQSRRMLAEAIVKAEGEPDPQSCL